MQLEQTWEQFTKALEEGIYCSETIEGVLTWTRNGRGFCYYPEDTSCLIKAPIWDMDITYQELTEDVFFNLDITNMTYEREKDCFLIHLGCEGIMVSNTPDTQNWYYYFHKTLDNQI